MNRAIVLKLETLRRRLEALLGERRGPEYTGASVVMTLHKIRELEAKPVSFRAPLPPEAVALGDPEKYGRLADRTFAELQGILRSMTDYNWGRTR